VWYALKESDSHSHHASLPPTPSGNGKREGGAVKLGEWKLELQEWHLLEEFHAKVLGLRTKYGRDLLTASGTDPFRDAHTAYRFASLRGATKLRLVASTQPDFEMDVAEGAKKFEVTEAYPSDRRRGDEVKGWYSGVKFEAVKDLLTPDVAERLLREAATRKNDSRYKQEWGLLILLDQWDFGEDRQAIEARMTDATAVAKDRFVEVWVLWQHAAYNTWLDGKRGGRILRR
jgi:hypothetical protein